MKFLLVIFLFSFVKLSTLLKTNDKTCETFGAMKFDNRLQAENSTCASAVIKAEICSNSSGALKWKGICISSWTVEAATVGCKQVGLSPRGANITTLTLSLSPASTIVPVCSGSENSILDCNFTSVVAPTSCKAAAIQCFPDSDVCFEGALTEMTTPAVYITSTSHSTNSTTTELVTINQTSPTVSVTGPNPIVDFWLSTPGLGVIVAVIVIFVFLFVISIIFIVILLMICKGPRRSNREPARVSPQNGDLDSSLKDTKDPVFPQNVFNNTPEQDRHLSPSDSHPDHHYIDHHGPIYEHVKDVPSPSASMSSQESNRSGTEASDSLPTYATIEPSASNYAQVQPCINGSLTRGNVEIYSHYRSLNRTTSQGSNLLPNREPRSLASMQAFSSDNSLSRGRAILAPYASNTSGLPVYSILEGHSDIGDDETSEFSDTAVLGHKLSTGHHRQHVAVMEASHHQPFHNASRLAKPGPYEPVMTNLKSSTLPSQGRSAPSCPNAGMLASQPRWSGSLDAKALPEQGTYLNTTCQNNIDVNTWV